MRAKTYCSRPLCWYFCWYRQAKSRPANFDIPNEGIELRHAPFIHFSRDVWTSTSMTNWPYPVASAGYRTLALPNALFRQARYLRDIVDISADASYSDKLAYNKDMDAMLRSLEGLAASAYSAIRSTKMVGAFWADKTPIPITIGYLTIVPSDRPITEILVPRRLS